MNVGASSITSSMLLYSCAPKVFAGDVRLGVMIWNPPKFEALKKSNSDGVWSTPFSEYFTSRIAKELPGKTFAGSRGGFVLLVG